MEDRPGCFVPLLAGLALLAALAITPFLAGTALEWPASWTRNRHLMRRIGALMPIAANASQAQGGNAALPQQLGWIADVTFR